MAESPETTPYVEAPVRTIGKFIVNRLIGSGGMGAVYEVLDPALNRNRALKMMLEGFAAKPGAKRRFIEEAKAMAAIDHENVVAILEFGEHNGQPYIVMPLLQGRSLETAIRAGYPQSRAERLLVAAQVARGLSAVHEAGLVHRDIKPGNIWIEENSDGSFRRAKLLDFGIARDEPDQGEAATQEAGTVGYMSLEQLYGTSLGPKTDIFSLGVVLYRMLTGKFPFSTRNWIEYHESLKNITPDEPCALDPRIPKALSDFVLTLVARSPENRPGNANQVAETLTKFANEREGPPAPAGAASAPWWQSANLEPTVIKSVPSTGQPVPVPPQHVPPPVAGTPPSLSMTTLPTHPVGSDQLDTQPEYEKLAPKWLPDSRGRKKPTTTSNLLPSPIDSQRYPYSPPEFKGPEQVGFNRDLDPRSHRRNIQRFVVLTLCVLGAIVVAVIVLKK